MTVDPMYEEPEIALERWAIVQHPEGTLHIAGLRDGDGRLSRMRMSTAIQSFDRSTLTAETSSGRVYHLASDGYDRRVGVYLTGYFFGAAVPPDAVILDAAGLELALSEPSSGLRH
jgi:hypothetical protein